MAILDEIQGTIRQLAETAGPSVVGLGQHWGVGSGIVLGEGRVLTNAHNVRGGQVEVTFADGRRYAASGLAPQGKPEVSRLRPDRQPRSARAGRWNFRCCRPTGNSA